MKDGQLDVTLAEPSLYQLIEVTNLAFVLKDANVQIFFNFSFKIPHLVLQSLMAEGRL